MKEARLQLHRGDVDRGSNFQPGLLPIWIDVHNSLQVAIVDNRLKIKLECVLAFVTDIRFHCFQHITIAYK